MLPAVQNPSQSPSSKASTRLSDEGRVKALAMLGTLRTLADDEPLIPVESCQRVIDTMTDDLQPCSPTDAQAFVALLLTAYPSIRQAIDCRVWSSTSEKEVPSCASRRCSFLGDVPIEPAMNSLVHEPVPITLWIAISTVARTDWS